jgi:hypothetical protein
MRLQKLTGKFPTEKPPDPENGSPGTAGTVAEAVIQRSVLRRTTPKNRKPLAANQSATLAVSDGQERVGGIVERGGGFDAYDASGRRCDGFSSRSGTMHPIPASGGV